MGLMFAKQQVFRCDHYRAFVRSLPCCVCESTDRVEAHHPTKVKAGGASRKGSDLYCIPLCYDHHYPGWHTMGRGTFCKTYNVNMWQEIARCQTAFIKRMLPTEIRQVVQRATE